MLDRVPDEAVADDRRLHAELAFARGDVRAFLGDLRCIVDYETAILLGADGVHPDLVAAVASHLSLNRFVASPKDAQAFIEGADLPPGESGDPIRFLAGMIVAGLAVGDLAAADRWTRSMDADRDRSPDNYDTLNGDIWAAIIAWYRAMCTRSTNAANERGCHHGARRRLSPTTRPAWRFGPAGCRRSRRSQAWLRRKGPRRRLAPCKRPRTSPTPASSYPHHDIRGRRRASTRRRPPARLQPARRASRGATPPAFAAAASVLAGCAAVGIGDLAEARRRVALGDLAEDLCYGAADVNTMFCGPSWPSSNTSVAQPPRSTPRTRRGPRLPLPHGRHPRTHHRTGDAQDHQEVRASPARSMASRTTGHRARTRGIRYRVADSLIAAARGLARRRHLRHSLRRRPSAALDQTVAYIMRSRGARKRPAIGWASRTPTERDVVDEISRDSPTSRSPTSC